MTTAPDALAQTLDTIRAEEKVHVVKISNDLWAWITVIADGRWSPDLHPSHEDYLDSDTQALKDRIMDALIAQKFNYRSQAVYVWTGEPTEGLIGWTFTAR